MHTLGPVGDFEADVAARYLLIGLSSVAGLLVLGAFVYWWRRWMRGRRAQQRRRWQIRLLANLELLDWATDNLVQAALRGQERLARERVYRLGQAISAANFCGDEELRRLVSVLAARCEALGEARQDEESLDRLLPQLEASRRQIYRRIEVLLAQVTD